MLKNFLMVALLTFQLLNFAKVDAAEIDSELAIIAAEQDNSNGDVLNPAENISSNDEKKKIVENKPEPVPPAEEKKSPPPENSAEKNPPQSEITKINPAPPVEEKKSPPPENSAEKNPPQSEITKIEPIQPVEENIQNPSPESLQPVSVPSPIVNYGSFEELAGVVGFTPLYLPKKSGYNMNEVSSIAGKTAEVRYSRRWEPQVSLHIRTYMRQNGEELRDISGIHGVKWRIDMTSGIPVYIAKINERAHAAAWSSGRFTFSAYVENLSFAAFHSLVIDELVDLTNHYYRN